MAGLDAQRTGRAPTALPSRPRLLWRARAAAGADFSFAVDGEGALVLASAAGVVTQIDARGRTSWTARTGSPVAIGPVLLSDGRRAVVTSTGELVVFDATGRLVLRRALPGGDVRNAVPALALDDGGLAFATGDTVLYIEHDGDIRSRSRLEGAVQSLLARGGELLAVTEKGHVFSLVRQRAPLRVGSFGGRIDEAAALALPDRLLAVVEHRRLIELRLTGGTRRTAVFDPVLSLVGPPVIAADGGTRITTADGMLLVHDARNRETLRVALEAHAGSGEGGAFAPPVVVDAQGRVAFARPGRDAGVVLPSGEIAAAANAACPDPIALCPAGSGRFAVACRSGALLMIGDAQ
jgi:outer membrane protein assembly factor BamB